MAKQKEDKKTGDLLASPGATRQAAFKARMRAAGMKQVNLWMTEAEEVKVRALLARLRK
jgi:hypothetical protein